MRPAPLAQPRRNWVIVTRLVNTCWLFFKLGAIVVVFAVVGVGVHLYIQVDDEIRREVQKILSRQYPHLNISVGAARLIEGRGIAIHDLVISETSPNRLQSNLLVIDEILLECDVQLHKLMNGAPEVRRITVRHPEAWLVRELDGTWNLATLWPLPTCSKRPPSVRIEDARITLVDRRMPQTAPISLRDINVQLKASRDAKHPHGATQTKSTTNDMCFEFHGTFGGPHVRRAEICAQCNLQTEVLEVTGNVAELKLNDNLFSWCRDYFQFQSHDFHLQGNVSGEFSFVHRMNAATFPQLKANFAVSDARLDHQQLPRALSDLSCKIHVDNAVTRVDHLTCNCGSAGLALQLERRGWEANSPLSLAVRAENVALDKEIYRVLPVAVRQQWDKFKPTGTVDADVQTTFDGAHWRPAIVLTGRDLAFESDKFAYRVHSGSGSLSYTPGPTGQPAVLNIDLTGHGGGQPLHFSGQIFDPQPGAQGWLEITGENIEIEDRMIAALPPKPQEVVRSLHPEGKFNLRWRIDRTLPGQIKPYTSLRLELVSCRVEYEKFPYPLTGIRGIIQAEDDRWTFRELLSGGSRNVTCQGTLQPTSTGTELSLQFVGKEIPFDDDLLQALSPQVRHAWEELRPRGRIDLVAEVYHATGLAKPSIRVAIQPRADSASIHPNFFPYLMENIEGDFTYQDGKVLMTDVRARHGRTTLRTNGSGEFRTDGAWHVQLEGFTVDRLSPRRDLIVAFPPKMQKVIDLLHPVGNNFGISNATLRFSKSAEQGSMPTSQWDLQLDCSEAKLQAGIDLENIHGSVRLRGYCDGQRCEQAGELALDTITFQDVQFTDVRGPIWIDESSCLVGRWACEKQGQAARHLTARVYDGLLTSDAWVTLEDVPKYGAEAALSDASLMRMMIERMHGQQVFNGKVAATLNIRGVGRSRQTLVGDGEIAISDANIYELPLLVSLLKVLRNGTSDTTAFNQSNMKFRIDGTHIYLDQLDFLGDAVSLYGQGTTNFDQDLNLVFHGVVGRNDFRIPFVKNIVDRAGRQIMNMYVTGTVNAPVVKTQALPGINQLIQQIQNDLDTVTTGSRVRQAERTEPTRPGSAR